MDLLDQFGLLDWQAGSCGALWRRAAAGGDRTGVVYGTGCHTRDEPTGNLDTTNGHNVIDALYHLNSAGQTIVLVTHDLSIANEAPRLIRFSMVASKHTGPISESRNAAWRAGH